MPTLVKLNCSQCDKEYELTLSTYNQRLKINKKFYCSSKCSSIDKRTGKRITTPCLSCGIELNMLECFYKQSKKHYCSTKCYSDWCFKNSHIEKQCNFCKKSFMKRKSRVIHNKYHFCSTKCCNQFSAYNKISNKRPKLERWLETKFKEIYPNLKIQYNNRTLCESLELDIYIPDLRLAFELNGPTHYEPIFGPETLKRMQKNDKNKMSLCIDKQIDLCIIDTRGEHFNEKKGSKFLKVITDIINLRIQQFNNANESL